MLSLLMIFEMLIYNIVHYSENTLHILYRHFSYLAFQNVRTVLLSVISLLNEPNTYSPANVDASVMYRRWRDSKGKDKEYENIIR